MVLDPLAHIYIHVCVYCSVLMVFGSLCMCVCLCVHMHTLRRTKDAPGGEKKEEKALACEWSILSADIVGSLSLPLCVFLSFSLTCTHTHTHTHTASPSLQEAEVVPERLPGERDLHLEAKLVGVEVVVAGDDVGEVMSASVKGECEEGRQ